MSVYNYNTLTRANDGNTFEFNTNCNVLYVDELPSGVTLSLAIDNQNNPAITLRPKTQLRFKQNDRLFFTPSASTAGTIRIFLFLDESNLLEFDQSQYSSESTISGTVDVDITAQSLAVLNDNIAQIGGSTTPVTNLTEIVKSNSTLSTRLIKATFQNTGSADLYTVPASKVAYIHAITLNTFGLANVDSQSFVKVAGNNIMIQVVNVDNESITNTLAPQTPIKMVATEVLNVTGATNSWTAVTCYLTEEVA
jgi:hypothetical protein|tara:strand:- start:450 stop:1205 length:756 start_codon:yes stop_codon:yes gene_type:complete